MSHSALVVVQSFGTQVEADLAKGVLESAGVDAMIQADTAGGMRPHLAWSGSGFRVLVREEDAVAAREMLKPPLKPFIGNLVVVQSFATQDEADAAKSALELAGINAAIQYPLSSVPLHLTFGSFESRVLVLEEDAAAAREVLKPPKESEA